MIIKTSRDQSPSVWAGRLAEKEKLSAPLPAPLCHNVVLECQGTIASVCLSSQDPIAIHCSLAEVTAATPGQHPCLPAPTSGGTGICSVSADTNMQTSLHSFILLAGVILA